MFNLLKIHMLALAGLSLTVSAPVYAMLNPQAGTLARMTQNPSISSFLGVEEPERQRIEHLATTPDRWIKNDTHKLQVEAARNRVFSGNWPDNRLERVFTELNKKQVMAKTEELAHTLKLSSSDEPVLQELEQIIFDPALPEENRDELLQLLIKSRKKPLIFKSAIEFGTANGKPVELYDISEIVKGQSGLTCGYHALHNLIHIVAGLTGADSEEAEKSLEQGPPLELWKDAVISAGSGQEENIRDDDIRLLLSLAGNLQPDQVTIIPNLREWNPSLDENFASVADQLQKQPGALQGFLVNTAGHVQQAELTPEVRQEIVTALAQKPQLQQAFVESQESHTPLSYEDENNIVQTLFDTDQQELIAIIRSLKETGHRSTSGHWTAVATRNNNGTLQLFAADSLCNPETKSFGNLKTLQTVRDWVTTSPDILQALTQIPNRLETAINVMEQNRDLQSGLRYLTQATDMIEHTPGLTASAHYRTVVEPLLTKADALVAQLMDE